MATLENKLRQSLETVALVGKTVSETAARARKGVEAEQDRQPGQVSIDGSRGEQKTA